MPLSVSATFLMHNTGGAHNPAGAHLMICVAINVQKDLAVIVPIVTRHERSDSSCVLNVGDHPFINRESCASYDFAQVVSLNDTNQQIAKGHIKLRASVSADVLYRLQAGFVLSDETAPWIFEAASGQKLTIFLKGKGYIK
ncbi:hypothetical protein RCO27_18090 [Sphingosinicella sp. LHD-64]|uniref:hypothetical protein n=1 Tax=Sphingosinicella sp. LHD-64 TaxID=3072139 RepID=UPI00280DE277|nr:hypothetical protein [Sphingosinicella sp. LHD-64]MDQ8758141.1 hypothetical protein [Sphingosinicella sp. LHD-64]